MLQYILPSNSVVYIGCVGKDKYGQILEDICAKAGVRTEYRYDEETPTGRCGVVITGHNRSLCTDLAAANLYKLDHLKQPEIWKLVEGAKFHHGVEALIDTAVQGVARNIHDDAGRPAGGQHRAGPTALARDPRLPFA